jgi:alanyl-tRNA synthetase
MFPFLKQIRECAFDQKLLIFGNNSYLKIALFLETKDNFFGKWEGPCGPCSEIHIDLRTDEERAQFQVKV